MKHIILLASVMMLSSSIAQNHFIIGTEFGSKTDFYYYINELGQTFRQSRGNPTFGFNFEWQHKQHILGTGFYAYKLWTPDMDYDFVTYQPKKSHGSSGSGLSDYWVPIKYAYEHSLNKKKNLLLQTGLAFNIMVGEYYANQPDGSWSSSSYIVGSNDPYSLNEGISYVNGRTTLGIEPQLKLIYRIAQRFDIFYNLSYQFTFKPKAYDLIVHTNSITNDKVTATRTLNNSLLMKVGFSYHFIKKEKLNAKD